MSAGKRSTTTPERRHAILVAALACIREQGLRATTLDAIRLRSGASVGSIYHHFGSKAQLVEAVYADGIRPYLAALINELAASDSARAGIEALVRCDLDRLADPTAWSRYLFSADESMLVGEIGELNAALWLEFATALAAWLSPHIEQGCVVSLPLPVYESLFFGPSAEFARAWLAGRSDPTPTQAQALLPTAVWKAVQCTVAGGRHAA